MRKQVEELFGRSIPIIDTENGKEVPIRFVREAGGVAFAINVAVPTPEGMAWMEIDCGDGSANVIGKHLAPLLKLDLCKKSRSRQPL